MSELQSIHPEGWKAAKGYANGILVPAGRRTLHVAGQIAWNAEQELVGADDFAAQFTQVLENVVAVVEAAGGDASHLTSMTVYVTDKRRYVGCLREIGAAWRATCGRHYPAMALVEVADLLEHGALVEIQATAALP